jgi:hypothetical protein
MAHRAVGLHAYVVPTGLAELWQDHAALTTRLNEEQEQLAALVSSAMQPHFRISAKLPKSRQIVHIMFV